MLRNTATLNDSKIMRALMALALALCLGVGSATLVGCSGGDQEAGTAEGPAEAVTVTLAVNDGSDQLLAPTTMDGISADATVLDVLEGTTLDVVVEDSQYGAYVTSIAGVAADATHGWTYTVNDQQPTESAGSLKIVDGDNVVWNYIEFTPESA